MFKYRYTKYFYGSRLSHIPDKHTESVFRFNIPSISLDINVIPFSVSLSLSENPAVRIKNPLYFVFRTKNLFWQKKVSLLPVSMPNHRIWVYLSAIFTQSKVLSFWSCLNIPDSQYLFIIIETMHLFTIMLKRI